jgi:hypothetical protein
MRIVYYKGLHKTIINGTMRKYLVIYNEAFGHIRPKSFPNFHFFKTVSEYIIYAFSGNSKDFVFLLF